MWGERRKRAQHLEAVDARHLRRRGRSPAGCSASLVARSCRAGRRRPGVRAAPRVPSRAVRTSTGRFVRRSARSAIARSSPLSSTSRMQGARCHAASHAGSARKKRAPPSTSLRPHSSAVPLRDLAHDREPDAGARELVARVEPLERAGRACRRSACRSPHRRRRPSRSRAVRRRGARPTRPAPSPAAVNLTAFARSSRNAVRRRSASRKRRRERADREARRAARRCPARRTPGARASRPRPAPAGTARATRARGAKARRAATRPDSALRRIRLRATEPAFGAEIRRRGPARGRVVKFSTAPIGERRSCATERWSASESSRHAESSSRTARALGGASAPPPRRRTPRRGSPAQDP